MGISFRRSGVSKQSGKHASRRVIGAAIETLEARLALTAGPVITEFLANNNNGIVDQDGDRSDWIEIYNDGDTPVDLAGWHLTDDASELDQWTFPSELLAPRSFLIVYASEKDRAVAGSQLHTNFKLDAAGEYLALVRPDDTIASEFNPTFSQQAPDISFGRGNAVETVTLVGPSGNGSLLVPNPAGALPVNWNAAFYDDTGWIGAGGTAPGGFGYDTGATEFVSPQAATLGLNPLGYWRLEETSGTTAANLGSLGAAANGTVAGAANVNVAGPQPAAFPGFEAANNANNFDGTNDAIDVGGGSFMSNMSAFTVMGWIRPGNFTADRVGLFGQNDAIEFGFISGTNSTVQIWTPGGGSLDVNYGFARNAWHHIAAVGNGTNLRIFIDGNLIGTGGAATNNYGASASGFRIGGNGVFDTTANFFTGDIDEVAAFNYALTQAQIQQVVGAATQGAGAPGGTVPYAPLIGTNVDAAMRNVNSTALVRMPFDVAGEANFSSLSLKVQYDDGFVAYLNGVEIARRNAPATLAANSAATTLRDDSQAVVAETIDVSAFRDVVHVGANVLAFHALNSAAGNTDFLIRGELQGIRVTALTDDLRYFTAPSPGGPNGTGTNDLGPIMLGASHSPNQPLASEAIVVTAQVTPSFAALGAVQLHYRVMYNTEVVAAMVDDGSVGGDVAGDGIYTGVIPANLATPGQMIRWYVTAADAAAHSSRWPLFADPTDSEQYLGTVIRDPSLTSNLPIFHWFLPPGQQGAADSDAGAFGSLYYDGEFYDNVLFDIHGQSTRGFAEKSYDVDFPGDHRFRLSDDLPRMKDINWLSNYADKTKLRNTLAYETFRDSGSAYHLAFPIRIQQNGAFFNVADFVEDGDDVFTERLGRNPDGALYKMYNRFDSASGEKKTRRDEDNSDLQAFYNGVHLAAGTARNNYLMDNVNLPATISYMVGTMLASNYDCCHKNYYLYRDAPISEGGTGEWEVMPWDVDLSWGHAWSAQVGYLHNQMTPDMPLFQGEADINDNPLNVEVSKRNDLLQALFNTPGVRDMYLRRVRTLMDQLIQPSSTPLDERVAEARIDELVALIGADGLADDAKWGTWQANGDWATQIAMLKNDYLTPRRDYLYTSTTAPNPPATLIPGPQPVDATFTFGAIDFAPTSGDQDQEYIELLNNNTIALDISGWTISGDVDYTFKPGTVIPAAVGAVPGKLYVSPNVNAFRSRTTGPSGGQGLFIQGGYDGHLSNFGGTLEVRNADGTLMTSTTFVGNPSPVQQYLRITEIMYHPSNPTPDEAAAGFTNDNAFEYLELQNTSATTTLSLSGVTFTGGVAFDFTGSAVTSLLPGARVLVVRNAAGFTERYGDSVGPIAGTYIGSLDNSGEKIKLEDSQSGTIQEFTYNDTWYPLTDGPGFALVARDSHQDRELWDTRAGWRPSDFALGTPGAGESGVAPNPGAIALNEIVSYGTGIAGDRIELRNTTAAPIDVSGWYLTDDSLNLTKYQLPTLPAIAAGGYLVLDQSSLWTTAIDLPTIGGVVTLQASQSGSLIGFQAQQAFGGSDADKSFGPYTKSDGDVDFVELVSPTLGTANSAPRVGPVVINEVMYNPPEVGDEFIELKNISAAPVNLENWSFLTGVSFTLPATQIAAGGYAIVSSIDPATFRSKYSIPANIPIVGPYVGLLNNAGDDLRFFKPGDEGADVLMDRVNFNDKAPWPTRPDGGGTSLARISATAYGNDPANWVSDVPGGTPGGANGFFDDTAPSVPVNIVATVAAGQQVQLSWPASQEPQSAVLRYKIFRDSVLIGTSTTPAFTDTIVNPNLTYAYQVSAVNLSQVESSRSSPVSARVLVVSQSDAVGTTQVRVTFNSPLNATTAQNVANYLIVGVNVTGATLEAGGSSVLLTTSTLTNGQFYRVITNGVQSNAGVVVQPNSNALFLPGGGAGLLAQYYNEPDTGPDSTDLTKKLLPANFVASRTEADLNRNFAANSFDTVNFPTITDYFSARWTGKLKTLAAGSYTFTASFSDGLRLWFWPEGQPQPATPIIDRWTVNSGTTASSLPQSGILADTKYNIKVEWFEGTGNAIAILRWTTPGATSVVIPASQFSLPVTLETTPPQVSKITVASSDWNPAFVAQLQAQGLGTGGVDVPLGGTSPALPWSNLNQVKVKFDSDVVVGAGSLSVGGVNVASYGVTNFSYDYTTFTGTWTLAQPIDLDRATISVAAGVTDLAGNTVSGARSGGVRVASGDVNGDGSVSAADRTANVARQMTSIGHASYATAHDINGDGVINIRDLVALQYHMDQSAPAPAPAAAAALVYRVDASPEGSTAAQPLRATRRAIERRDAAAADRALSARTESPVANTPSNTASSLRARRTARAAASAIDALFGDER